MSAPKISFLRILILIVIVAALLSIYWIMSQRNLLKMREESERRRTAEYERNLQGGPIAKPLQMTLNGMRNDHNLFVLDLTFMNPATNPNIGVSRVNIKLKDESFHQCKPVPEQAASKLTEKEKFGIFDYLSPLEPAEQIRGYAAFVCPDSEAKSLMLYYYGQSIPIPVQNRKSSVEEAGRKKDLLAPQSISEHGNASQKHNQPKVAARFQTVAFLGTEAGKQTPLTIDAGNIRVAFSSEPEAGNFFVGADRGTGMLGYSLMETAGHSGSKLRVAFSEPVRQVLNLSIAVRSNSESSVTVEMFSNSKSVGLRQFIIKGMPDLFTETTVKLDPEQFFDAFTVMSDDPSKEFAIGNFQIVQTVIKKGDLNYDGAINENDIKMLLLAYTGPSQPVIPWAKGADLDEDGDVDVSDYKMLIKGLDGAVPNCAIAVPKPPARSHDAVLPGTAVALTVDAVDLAGGTLAYAWKAESGIFDHPTSPAVLWTAPDIGTASYKQILIELTMSSSNGCNQNRKLHQPVENKERNISPSTSAQDSVKLPV